MPSPGGEGGDEVSEVSQEYARKQLAPILCEDGRAGVEGGTAARAGVLVGVADGKGDRI